MKELISTIKASFHGGDPFAGIQAHAPREVHGFFDLVEFFDRTLDQVRPHLVIEVGSWQGKSAIHTARKLSTFTDDFGIICIDTWLGSLEHRLNPDLRKELHLHNGYPTIYEKFLENIVAAGFEDYVCPLPIPSSQAAAYLSSIRAPFIFIDGAHDYLSVKSDIEAYWPLVSPGGILYGDDYNSDWPGLKRAYDEFFADRPERPHILHGKYIVQKQAT